MSERKRWLVRALLGGVIGLALAALCHDVLFTSGYSAPALCQPLIDLVGTGGAMAITYLLCFALGGAVGLATLPFADEGRALVLQSLGHFALTAGICALLLGLCFGVRQWQAWLLCLALLALVYALIWLARWVGWYAEADAIRKKLGLVPVHSLFHWREILPYLPFAVGLCWVLPAVLRVFDPADVPLLTGLLLPYVFLPVGGFFSGAALGRRQGMCPLYPMICGLLYLPTVFILYNQTALFHCVIVFGAALVGNVLGVLLRKQADWKKGGDSTWNPNP